MAVSITVRLGRDGTSPSGRQTLEQDHPLHAYATFHRLEHVVWGANATIASISTPVRSWSAAALMVTSPRHVDVEVERRG